MKTLITIVVAFFLGLTIVGCATTSQAVVPGNLNASQDQIVSGEPVENLPPDEYQANDKLAAVIDGMRQEDVPYDEVFTSYINASRDELQNRFGIPDNTTKYTDKLVWEWCVEITLPNKLSPKAKLVVELGSGDQAKKVRTMSVEFLDEIYGGKYIPLGSNCATLINSLSQKRLYADKRSYAGLGPKPEYFYILGKLKDVDVLVTGRSSVWGLVTETSINDEGLRETVLKSNPGFDWRVGEIKGIFLGPRPKTYFLDSNVDQNIKEGRFVEIR